MLQINRKQLSSLLIAFSFFQFGIMQPFAILLGSQLSIAISTIIIFLILLVTYKFQFKKYVFNFLMITTVIFLTNYFLFSSREIILLIFIEFLTKCFSLVIIGSYPFKISYLNKFFYIFSIVNFVALAMIVLLGLVDLISYMRFGYAMLPTLLVSIYALRNRQNNHKLLWIFILISSFILMFIYGSRGPLLGLFIFIFLILFFDAKMHYFKKICIFVIMLGSFGYVFIFNGFSKLLNFIYYELNFQTYSIIKLRIMIEEGLVESSSGRDYLYNHFFEQIMMKPIFGNGIGITQDLWGVTPHNIILQIMLEFGIIGLAVFIFLGGAIIYLLVIIRKADNNLFLLLSIIFSVSFGRLLVSSDIWLRQELWLFISILINAFLMVKVKRTKRSNLPSSTKG